MKKVTLFTISALMLGFVACQKEENNITPEVTKPAPTKKEMLVAKTWTLSAMTITPAYMGKTDLYTMIDACEKDNTWKFSDNMGKLTINEGSNICKGSNAETITYWNLNDEGDRLTIDKYDYSLKSVNSTQFQMEEVWSDKGVDYTITSTYSGN